MVNRADEIINSPVARKHDIAQRFSRAAAHYADYAALQAAIASRLLSGVLPAGVVLDAGCGRGRDSLELSLRPEVEKVIALDMAPAMLAALPASPRLLPVLADIEATGLQSGCVDVVFSNFALQWCASRADALAELARVLKPGGELLVSVPGPESLAALRASPRLHINRFAGPEEWASALQIAGFVDVNITRAEFALYYDSPSALLRAVQGIGAGSSDEPRANHLQGRTWWQQVSADLELQRQPQGLPLAYDVIFMKARREA